MNGRQIEIFHTVMKIGTITDAADRLGVTQPAVTASIKQTESSLGFQLFTRSGGRLHPTAEARILFKEAERIQDSLLVFKQLANRLKKDIIGHLRISALPAFSHDLIPDTLAEFLTHHDDCLLDVTTQHNSEILNDMATLSGQNTIGFTFGLDDRQGIGSIPIGKAAIVALLPKSSNFAEYDSISFEELASQKIIGTYSDEPLGRAIEKFLHETGNHFTSAIRVHNHSVAAKLVSKGIGATIIDAVTASYAQTYCDPDSFTILPIKDIPALPVTAVYSYERPINSYAKKFIDIFRKHYRQQSI